MYSRGTLKEPVTRSPAALAAGRQRPDYAFHVQQADTRVAQQTDSAEDEVEDNYYKCAVSPQKMSEGGASHSP